MARSVGIDQQTFSNWINNTDHLQTVTNKKMNRFYGGGRKPNFLELEDALFQWIIQQRERKLPVREKAIVIRAR